MDSFILFFTDGVVAVDEECQLENAHVYHGIVHGRFKFFTASMTLVDIVLNKNSYQLIQLIESDDKKRYDIAMLSATHFIRIILTIALITFPAATGFLKSTDASQQRFDTKHRLNMKQKMWQCRNLRNVFKS